ncbi:uncharacterized protein LOC114279028 [Camellia sinensis]|uniref:uncharacterized protein LOC114279028 n=1 Tax=Camellia sinensis TaxID=4442 RepID=UPI001036DD94|nr:uncharacterized protein LOC114279028 [Camellia sinensis]
MGLGALRSIIRPVSRTLLLSARTPSPFSLTTTTTPATSLLRPLHRTIPWIPASSSFHSLTDTRLPKRRPADKPKRKRASLKPPGPYAFVKYVPGEPILPNQPNEGSVKRRNEKKRMRQRRAFILSEAKKRKAQLQEAKRKKNIKRIRAGKMHASGQGSSMVLKGLGQQLQRLEEEKKKAMA